ncbi:MAG: hypothetical protein GC186_11580 [Rhodobacteraceae bacterium]|nr:hypothetical protein [Paracoccaceae bacterium]
MKRLILILPLVAAACATFGPPEPVEAKLSTEQLVVTMSNGETCVGDRAAGTPITTGWSGKLSGCSQALPYEVSLDPHRNLLQGFFGELFKLIGLNGLAPNGQVRVTDSAGRAMMFISPPPTTPHDLH